MGDLVVPVQDQQVFGALVQIKVFLGGDILLHIPVDVQMIRREVRDDGDVGAVGEVHELER